MAAASRAGTAASVVLVLLLAGGCGSSDTPAANDPAGCGLSSAASLEKALGSDQLSSTGQGSVKKPDPETGLVTCDTERTDRAGYTVHVQVQDASAADVRARKNWLGDDPKASPGCRQAVFVKDDQLAGVSCVEKSSKGEGTRVYVVSEKHTIVAELALAAEAKPADSETAFAIAQSVQRTIE